jgi:hypothetical protein
MAIIEVKVPQLSESVAEATLLQWKKKPGDAVAADEILIEIETDKVVLEVPAPSAGVLAEFVVADGGDGGKLTKSSPRSTPKVLWCGCSSGSRLRLWRLLLLRPLPVACSGWQQG